MGATPRHRRRWTAHEDRTLRVSAGIVPVDAVAARLGHTLGDVARLLGVGACTARRWIAAGWLAAARREVRLGRHPLWLVGSDDLEDFLRECRPVYEPGRIRDPAWRAFVAALPPERDPWLTPCEAAPLIGCTAHGVRKRIASGRLVARRWGGRYYLQRSAIPHPTGRSRRRSPA